MLTTRAKKIDKILSGIVDRDSQVGSQTNGHFSLYKMLCIIGKFLSVGNLLNQLQIPYNYVNHRTFPVISGLLKQNEHFRLKTRLAVPSCYKQDLYNLHELTSILGEFFSLNSTH